MNINALNASYSDGHNYFFCGENLLYIWYMKKYELLFISNNIQKIKDINDIILFLNELLSKIGTEKFFMTFELTLLVYNIVLNNLTDLSYVLNKRILTNVKQTVLQIFRQLYEQRLTPEFEIKITQDIDYIEKHKEYTYIYDVFWVIYCFFF